MTEVRIECWVDDRACEIRIDVKDEPPDPGAGPDVFDRTDENGARALKVVSAVLQELVDLRTGGKKLAFWNKEP